VFMVLDVIEETPGRYHVWGKTDDGRSVLCRVQDFQPYFYIAAPVHAASLPPHALGTPPACTAWSSHSRILTCGQFAVPRRCTSTAMQKSSRPQSAPCCSAP
jgi:hypothetical protein